MNMRVQLLLPILIVQMTTPAYGQFGTGVLATDQVQLSQGERLMAADVDGDGWNDLVMQAGGEVLWLRNANGSGAFEALGTLFSSDTIYHFDLADLDGDLDLDLVVVHGTDPEVIWVENQGSGQINGEHFIGSFVPMGLGTLLCHDIDSDGDMDVLLRANAFHFFRNGGTGQFTEVATGLGTNGPINTILLAGDVDLDGDQDLLIVDWNGWLLAYLNLGLGTDWQLEYGGTADSQDVFQHKAISLHDVDGDGDLDVVSAMSGVRLMRNPTIPDGWGEFTSEIIAPNTATFGIGWSGTLGCGNAVSVLWQNTPWTGPVMWSTYSGATATFAPPIALMDSIRSVQLLAADLNNDGANDIIIADRDNPHIWWFPNLIPALGGTLALTPFDTLCVNGDPYALDHAIPAGGTWTGEGVDNNIFTPTGSGSFALTYNFTDPGTGCPMAAAQPIVAVYEPVITLVSGNPDECALDPLHYMATPSGGTWSGIADAFGVVDRSCEARPLSGEVSYDMNASNGGGCAAYSDPMFLLACFPLNLGPDQTLCANRDTLVVSTSQFSSFSGFDDIVYSGPTAWGYFYAAEHPIGQYELSVVGVSPNYCPGYDTLLVNVVAPPAVSLTAPDAVDIDGGPVTFDDGTPEGGWHIIGGIESSTVDPISYNVGESIVVIYFYTDPSTGCTGSDTAYVMVEQITSATYLSWSAVARVSPNPTNGQCQVWFGDGNARITLVDGVGRAARVWQPMRSPAWLDLLGLSAGGYLLTIESEGWTERIRLVIN